MSVFNGEEYLKQSIQSILYQTFTDFEVICIDDGSKDNTVAILNEYASLDKRIKVIAKNENQGLAVARNESLALAKGKYVVFFVPAFFISQIVYILLLATAIFSAGAYSPCEHS